MKSKSKSKAAYKAVEVPARGSRPAKPAGTDRDHPLNKKRAPGDTKLAPGPHHGQHKKFTPRKVR